MFTTQKCYYLILFRSSSIVENVKREFLFSFISNEKNSEKVLEYLNLREYSKRINRSLASVYRDAEKGLLKIAIIEGKKHVIYEEEKNKLNDNEKLENTENAKNIKLDNLEKEEATYQDAEIIDDSTNLRYEIEIFKSSITTIEDLANRIEQAKNETIKNLKEENEKKEKAIENLNEIIKTLSNDNHELRTQIAIRETERIIDEKKLGEVGKLLGDNEKLINQCKVEMVALKEKKAELLLEIDQLKEKIKNLEDENKTLEGQIVKQQSEIIYEKSFWQKL